MLAGWSGSAGGSYAYATVQPALVRGAPARVIGRLTLSDLRVGGVDLPGVMAGPAVVWSPPDLSVSVGLGLGARRLADAAIAPDAVFTAEAFWRPAQRASLYVQTAFGPFGTTAWGRVGGSVPVTPRDRPLGLWLGLEATTSGALPKLATEVGPVAEVPIRAMHGSLAVRASAPPRELERVTWGVSGYWGF